MCFWPPFPSRKTMRKHSPDAATIVSMPPNIIDPALLYTSDNHLPAIASLRRGRQRPGCIQPSPSWHMTPNNNLIPPTEQSNIINNVPYVSRQAMLLMPRSITSDFNFPKWYCYGRGSGKNGNHYEYYIRLSRGIAAARSSGVAQSFLPSRDTAKSL